MFAVFGSTFEMCVFVSLFAEHILVGQRSVTSMLKCRTATFSAFDRVFLSMPYTLYQQYVTGGRSRSLMDGRAAALQDAKYKNPSNMR